MNRLKAALHCLLGHSVIYNVCFRDGFYACMVSTKQLSIIDDVIKVENQ